MTTYTPAKDPEIKILISEKKLIELVMRLNAIELEVMDLSLQVRQMEKLLNEKEITNEIRD